MPITSTDGPKVLIEVTLGENSKFPMTSSIFCDIIYEISRIFIEPGERLVTSAVTEFYFIEKFVFMMWKSIGSLELVKYNREGAIIN